MSIRTLLIDDEPLARRNLRALFKSHPDFEIVAECGSGQEALAVLKANPIDLMFLDVQMPEMTGFQMLEKLDAPRLPFTIFVTAFDEYAIKAFEVNAADYLLKPVDDKRFERSLSRAKALIGKGSDEVEKRILKILNDRDASSKYSKRLLIRTNSRVFFLEVDEIDYITAEDYYSALHVGVRKHLLREPIRDLEARLDPSIFVRIHRSAMVNIRRVKELRTLGEGGHVAQLIDGTSLRISRTGWERLQQTLSVKR